MSNPVTDNMFLSGELIDYSIQSIVTAASGLIVGTNPAYSVDDFFEFYPQFKGNVPPAVVGVFVALASATLQEARFKEAWTFVMALFVAHYCTLHLQVTSGVENEESTPTGSDVYSAGLARGIQVSKSIGPLSVSYQAPEGLQDWGAWNLTVYGQQLAQMAKVFGLGILWIY